MVTVHLRFRRLPSLWPAYLRALLVRRPGLVPAGHKVGRLEATLEGLCPPREHLRRYRSLLGFPESGALPLPYPHLLAMPLHMHMLTHPAFPVSLLGLVHLRNRIESTQKLGSGVPLDLHCWLEGYEETPRGQEFLMITTASLEGQVAWRETSTFLARRAQAGGSRPTPPPPPEGKLVTEWGVPASMGRAYASLSGDWNPIHISRPTARLFGYPCAIAHGMGTLARCLAEFERVGVEPAHVEVSFKRPVLLPGRVALWSDPDERFRLVNAAKAEPHLEGQMRS